MEWKEGNVLRRLVKRPSSLFAKIFLWFSIYIITVFAVGIYISTTSVSLSSKSRVLEKISGDALVLYGQTLVERYEKEGNDAVVRSLEEIEKRGDLQVYFFDGRGNEISGRSSHGLRKEQIVHALKRKRDIGIGADRRGRSQHYTMRRLTGGGGETYVVLAKPAHDLLGELLTGFALSRLIIFVIAAVCFSYLLSRYLTHPIRTLQAATRKLALGDLSTRIGFQRGKRRDELVSLAGDFDSMAEKIEILEDRRRQFLSDVSHELRSPLSRLNIAVEMARNRNHSDISDHLDRIELESGRLESIIGRILAFTRKKRLEAIDKPVPLDLSDLFDEILRDANFKAQNKNCSVKMVTKTEIELNGIRHLIKSALENVIDNAVNYTREGTSVEVSLDTEDRSGHCFCIIRIRDHGKGVPEDSLRKIFQPFSRVDDSRDRRSGGSGLGLAITERAIRYHHGTVEASNATDGGLIVKMTIPMPGFKPDSIL